MNSIKRSLYTECSPFIEEIQIFRYAIIGQGGSQLILLFEAEIKEVKKQYMIAFQSIDKEFHAFNENEYLQMKAFEAIDKDLTVSLKYADRLFANAEAERKLSQ